MTINERVKIARQSCEMTQEQFASALNVSRSKISMIEDGNRMIKADDIPAIAKALNVSCNFLLTGTDNGDRSLADELGLRDESIITLKQEKEFVTAINYFCITGKQDIVVKLFRFLFTYYKAPETAQKVEDGYQFINDTYVRAFPLMVPKEDDPNQYTFSFLEDDVFEKAALLKLQEDILKLKNEMNQFIEDSMKRQKKEAQSNE